MQECCGGYQALSLCRVALLLQPTTLIYMYIYLCSNKLQYLFAHIAIAMYIAMSPAAIRIHHRHYDSKQCMKALNIGLVYSCWTCLVLWAVIRPKEINVTWHNLRQYGIIITMCIHC